METARKRLIQVMFIILVIGTVFAQRLFAAPVFKHGDRVVIYGDSITDQKTYSRYLQQYIYCRYPGIKVKFFNAGQGGDTAPGALGRVEQDVLVLKPTVVTLLFGMNDGGYRTLDEDVTSTYRDNMEKLIKTLQEHNIRVVVFAPGCVDYDQNKGLGEVRYNEVLETLGRNAFDLAKKYNCPTADVFHAMLNFQTAQKALDPKYTMTPDSVHPNPAGHLVMTYAMLKGLGAEPMPALGDIDLTTGVGKGLRVVNKIGAKVVLETTGSAMAPFWFADDNAGTVRDSGFIEMVGPEIKIRGGAGSYSLSVDNERVGEFTANQLAAGVRIAGSYSTRGKLLHDTILFKETQYEIAWRGVRLGLSGLPAHQQCVNSAMALDNCLHQNIWMLADPRKSTITLERLP